MYFPDHLDIYETILNNQPAGIINASSGDPYKIIDLAQCIKEITNSTVKINSLNNSKPTSIVLDNSKIKALGFKPKFKVEQGLIDFFNQIT
jgi:nucleoside-diphosphate-sugar epimerase